jgi:hypothetical protein
MKNDPVSFKLVCAVVLAGVVLAVVDPSRALQRVALAIGPAHSVAVK